MDVFQQVFAFSLGLMSFVSPCVLPVIPGYIAYLFGNDRLGRVWGTISILVGIAVGGLIIGMLLSVLGAVGSSKYFYLVAALLLALLTLEAARPKIIKPISFSWLHGRKGLAAGFVFGLLIIFIASPCVVPLLAAAAIFALTSESVLQRAGLLLAYSAGLGLPFIAIAAFFGSSKRLSEFSRKGVVHKVQLIVLAATIVWLLWLFLSF